MYATPEDLLGVPENAPRKELVKARNNLALAYHPDAHWLQDALLEDALKKRMQEANRAFEFARKKTKRV
jgi:DnaJ-class molecular chaperone